MTADPRHIAFKIIQAASTGTTTLDQALDRFGQSVSTLPVRDRNLCHAIVFGVLRHRGRLDFLIRAFSERPFEALDAKVVEILRMALFQVLYLDRVPDFAAIDTAIELSKKMAGKKASGFINAVLRKAAKAHAALPLPDPKKQFIRYLRVVYSIPDWLSKRWIQRYGREKTEALCRTLSEIPSLTLRVNTQKARREDVTARLSQSGIDCLATELSPFGIRISGHSPSDLPGFSEGFFQVQDEAAQLVSQLLNPKPGDRVLDACAGLGGKTCHLGQFLSQKGKVTATDIDPEKLEKLKAEAERLGLASRIQCRSIDITKATIKDFDGYFDRVLVDAPCTGLGVIRRNPDTRWKRSAKDILRMAARQKKVLNAAAGLVVPGGVLVYAVCSCEPEENEGVVTAFLDKRKDFSADTGAVGRLVPGLSGTNDFYAKTFPDIGTMDGFFMARMRRKAAQ